MVALCAWDGTGCPFTAEALGSIIQELGDVTPPSSCWYVLRDGSVAVGLMLATQFTPPLESGGTVLLDRLRSAFRPANLVVDTRA